MHLVVINPNTTASMTRLIGESARSVAAPGTTVTAVNPDMGPASVESHYDEAMAVPGLLREVVAGEASGVDGYVIGCFGDPGLDAARELAAGPVVGIAEAGFHLATMLGRSFSVVTTLGRTIGQAEHLIQRYGFTGKCRSIYACEVAVLDLDDPASDARKLVVDYCRRAVEHDEADSIVLGCAGMADFCHSVSEQVGVPVIDGVTAGVLMVESLIKLGLKTSTRSEYAAPLPKAMSS
jgi:allantoin racemase